VIVEAIVIGALVVGAAVFGRRARHRAITSVRIDPFTLTDPWRSFVQDAISARARFGRVVDTVAEGPLREQLAAIEDRVDDGVKACWLVADTGYRQHKLVLEVSGSPSESLDRMRAKEAETRERLAALTKNLDEAVARAAELATGQTTAALPAVADDVDNAVNDLEALRQALAEIDEP
jgi:hypothetical protein